MNAAQRLHALGQNLWLDNLSRELLDDGTMAGYIREFALTGLTSNPTIFDKAIRKTNRYDRSIAEAAGGAVSDEAIFFGLALQDLIRAAGFFRPAFEASGGADGWVSLEVSPLLADDTAATIAQAKALHARAGCPNLFIKIPGNRAGIPAIEESIAAGIPINVTLLFSTEQCLAAADAYRRGIERRLAAKMNPVRSVASLFVSRWDKAVADASRRASAIGSASRWRSKPTGPGARCTRRRHGGALPTPAFRSSVCSGRAPGPRTRLPPMCSTSKRSPRPIRS
jgi:transaldolase